MFDARIRLRHIRCFSETARLGSLSAAAQTLSVSQPAASKTIRELEEVLGVDLFDRSNRRLTLTQAGRIFQQHCGTALRELSRAQSLVQQGPKQTLRLSIGALPSASTQLLPDAALAFREQSPDCQLRVSTGPNWLLMSQLREGSLDMVVGRMGSAKVMEGLTFHPLYSERICVVTRPGHPIGQSDAPQAEIANYPLMLPPGGAVISPTVRQFLSGIGITAAAPAYESVALAFGRSVVSQSDTIWFISHGVVQDELRKGELVEVPIASDLLGGPVGISLREDAVDADIRQAFIDCLKSAAAARQD